MVIMTTLPDIKYAEDLASVLVRSKLAACVQILPQMTSVYEWEGALQQDTEVLLLIKTVSSRFSAVEKAVKENHPYTVPEVVAIPASDVSDDYLKWMKGVL